MKFVEWAGTEVAALGRDDAGADRSAQAERIARDQDPIPDLRPARIAPCDPWQRAGGADLDDRDIGQLVPSDHPRRQLAPVRKRYDDCVRMPDDMVVGHDRARGIDDEPRPGPGDLLLLGPKFPPKLATERGVAQFGGHFGPDVAAGHGFGDRDVHHCWQHLLDQRCEAFGRTARVCAKGRSASTDEQSQGQNQAGWLGESNAKEAVHDRCGIPRG